MTDGESIHPVSRVRQVFLKVRELPERAAREAYLETACKANPGLKAEVLDLLEAEFASEVLLDQVPSDGREITVGTMVGRYRIIERLGEGGFGEIFRVEQTEPVHRELALKTIKPGMDSHEVIARFELEEQALALMDHPNIAQVYDAGTTLRGRPYYVMELVRGPRITTYCDQEQLSISERLKLFQTVCSAVQHAHQRGIIHRDLKPSNIVITSGPGMDGPVPKIIDFGIAKSLQGSLTDNPLVTQREVMLGTPAYMSPEQLELSSEQLDTRTDVYSLGILLYELLAGVPPFERETLERVGYAEIRRVILQQEPPRPSARLLTLGQTASTVAQSRMTALPTLERVLRGDLDWIVMKAIEKDRARRYQGAGALAEDIGRYLDRRPVEASPPSRTYRLRKFVSRHRVGSALSGALVTAVLVGLISVSIGLNRTSRERNRAMVAELMAEANSVRLMAVQSLLAPYLWYDPNSVTNFLLLKGEKESVSSSRLLRDSLTELVTRLEDPPPGIKAVERDLRKVLADSFLCLELTSEAVAQLDRIIDLNREEFGPNDIRYADSLMDKAHALTTGFQGVVEFSQGFSRPRPTPDWQKTAARKLVAQAAAVYRRNNCLSPYSIEAEAKAESGHGDGWLEQGRNLVELHTQYYGANSFRTLGSLFDLAVNLAWRGRLEEAEPLFQRYQEAAQKLDDGPYTIIHSAAPTLGTLYERNNRPEDAERIYREEISRLESKVRGEYLFSYAGVLRRLNRLLGAEGRPDPSIQAKLARINLWRALDPALCRADYRLHIETPGTYRLYLRWDGFDIGSNEICARIRELQDGPGGALADVYGFVIPDYTGDADFSSVIPWQDRAIREAIGERMSLSRSWAAEWAISEPGTYTLQLIGTDTGAAVDAFVLQLADLSRPEGRGPSRTVQNGDGSYNEIEGRIVVEAEMPSSKLPGRITEWLAVPFEADPIVGFVGHTGEGYLQVLPEGDPMDPVELIRNRAYAAELSGHDRQALDFYSQAITRAPSAESYLSRGLAFERLGEYENALADLLKSIDLDPNPLNPAYPLFWDCHLRLGNNDYLIETVLPFVESNAGPEWMKAKLARARANKGLWREAIEGIQPMGGSVDLWVLRGDLYAENADYLEARREFLTAVERDRRDLGAQKRLAALYLVDGDRTAYEAIVRNMPIPDDHDLEAYRQYVWISTLGSDTGTYLGRLKEVLSRFLDRFPAVSEKDRLIRAELAGAAFYRLGQFAQAVEFLAEAQEIDAKPWGAYRSRWMFFLAMTLWQMDAHEEARSWYERANTTLAVERISVPANQDPAYPVSWDVTITMEVLQKEAAARFGIQPGPAQTVPLNR